MKRPIHFEILADDPEAVGAFYSKVLDWEVSTWEGGEYWLVKTGKKDTPGIDGGIMRREFQQAVINTVEVESLAETLEKVKEAGGKLVHGPHEVPGEGTHAYCADPEGNLFGLMEPQSND
jgi:predicted enzyme related to lactoylglutathione lyase